MRVNAFLSINSPGKRRCDQKGFSLIEVLIAIAILSFIVIGIASITGSSQDKAIDTVNEDRQILQVETAMSRIEWDVSQAYSPLYFDHAMEPTGLDETAGQVYNQMVERYTVNPRFAFPSYFGQPVPTYRSPEDNTLTFFATANRRKFKNAKQSHFAWIKYQLVEPSEVASFGNEEQGNQEEEKGFVLTRKFMPDNVFQPEEIQWDKIKSQVLLRNVVELVFEFWNQETRKWTDNIATVKNGLHLVRGLKINLKWIDPDGIERTFIRVFRPLFPSFEPENMYKLIKEARAANARNNNQNPNQPGGPAADPGNQNPDGQGNDGAQGGGGAFQ